MRLFEIRKILPLVMVLSLPGMGTAAKKRAQAKTEPKSDRGNPADKFGSLGDYTSGPKISESDLKKIKVDEAKTKKNASRKTFTANEFGLDAADLVYTFKAINTLIKKEKDGARRTVLLLNRAKIFYMLGQSAYLAQKSTVDIGPKAKRYFTLGKGDASEVLRISALSTLQKIEATIVVGLVEIYSGNEARGVALFESAFNMDPQSRWAAWTGLYIAEHQFESSKFQEAKNWYNQVIALSKGNEKKLALYKLGWTEINLEHPDAAEKIFIGLIRSDPNDSWGKDSARDLAVLISGRKTPKELFSITQSVFANPEQGRDFLKLVNTLLYDRGQTADAMVVTEYLLSSEKVPQEVIKLKLLRLRANAKGFASKKQADLYVDLVMTMEKFGVMKNQKVFNFYKEDLHYETMALMSAYVDTFSARIKTPEKFSKQEIGTVLTKIYPIYEKYFPRSEKLPQVMDIWMNTCIEIGDDRCAVTVATRIVSKPQLASIHQRVRHEKIAALERLLTKNEAKPEELILALQEYESAHPHVKEIEAFRSRQVDLYVQIDDKEHALRTMQTVYRDFPSKVNLSRLQALRFKYGRFAEIVAERAATPFETEEVIEFRRNAILKLAEEAKSAGRYRRVAELVDLFTQTKPTQERINSVKEEFAKFLVTLGEADFLLEWVKAQGAVAYALPAMRGDISEMEDQLLWKGDFARLLKFDEINPKKEAKLYYRMALCKLAIGQSDWVASLGALQPAEREYFLSAAIYQYPKDVYNYLNGQKKLGSDEKILLLLAARIIGENRKPEDAVFLQKKLGDIFPSEWKDKAYSKATATACFKELNWPKSDEKEAAFTQKLQLGVARHQQCKKLLESDMKNPAVPLEDKEDLAEDAADMERYIVKLIQKSPRPAGLTPEQLKEYNAGLDKLVGGYEKEAGEFDKLEDKIHKDRKSEKPAGLQVLERPGKWKYPDFLNDDESKEHAKAEALQKLMSSDSTATAALLYLDLMLLEKHIKQDAYEDIRLGHLLSRWGRNEGVRRVLLDYVDTRGLKSLKSKWEEAI